MITAGMICLAYGVMAVFLGRPDPFLPWLPGVSGLLAAILIALGAVLAGRKNATIAHDEGYFNDSHRAQRISFWVAISLYPLFGIAIWQGWSNYHVAFAAMGTLTAASFLLLFGIFDLRGRW